MVCLPINASGWFCDLMGSADKEVQKCQRKDILGKFHGKSTKIDCNHIGQLKIVKDLIGAGQQLWNRKIGDHAQSHDSKSDWESLCQSGGEIVFHGYQ